MTRVYIAGPYSSADTMTVLENIGKGIRVAADLLLLGFAPFCPWLDCLIVIHGRSLSISDMKAYSMAWLERSDCVLVLSGWENSEGTKAEIARAQELEIPVYYNMADLMRVYANH